ncbi:MULTISPECIES: hypothetical protein [unclassified Serratia (in: enterobacteria)]|uniref:hypothetical protein n=1 Tax=unclassified Serratia (in: enterobacteria) TaxID=2647522 RepID=UPI0030762E85
MRIVDDDYRRFLPPTLYDEAERLLAYLTDAPFKEPDECPWCQHNSFKVRERAGQKPGYTCFRCRKTFTRTTGTPFSNTQYPELWGDYVRYRFSGLPLSKIAQKLGITDYACCFRDRIVKGIMQREYPTLYDWWQAHQERISREMTPEIEAQRAQFQAWLNTILTCERAACPTCGYSSRREGRNRHRPWFFCNPCRKGFSLLTGTPLAGMLYTEIWASFVDHMISGDSMWQLQSQYHIGTGTLHRWRKSFLAMMADMGLDGLVEWAQWQRSRGYNEALKKRRSDESLPRPGKSRFNGRGQLKHPST